MVLLAIARRRCRSLKTENASLASHVAELERESGRLQTNGGDTAQQHGTASDSEEPTSDGCAEKQETFVETYSMLFDVKNSIPPIVSVLEQSSQRLERDTVTAVKKHQRSVGLLYPFDGRGDRVGLRQAIVAAAGR